MIDVTVPLQCLVKDSKLILTEASKVGARGRWEEHLGKRDPLRGSVTAAEPVMLPRSLCGMHPRTQVTATLERLTSSIHPAIHLSIHSFVHLSIHCQLFFEPLLCASYSTKQNIRPAFGHSHSVPCLVPEGVPPVVHQRLRGSGVCARGELKHRGAQAERPGPGVGSWSCVLCRASLKMEGVLVWQRGKSRTK